MLKIAKKLKDLNVPTKRSEHWNQSTINSILNNPLYIGIKTKKITQKRLAKQLGYTQSCIAKKHNKILNLIKKYLEY